MKATLLPWCLAVTCSLAVEHPAELSDSDLQQLRAAYATATHEVKPLPDGRHETWNASQAWHVKFDDRGFTVTPKNAAWTWGLESPDSSSHSHSSSNHLYHTKSGGITEWFINGAGGLQQGWILTQRVEGIPLRVRGRLKPVVSRHSVSFEHQLTYSGLKAWDAEGREVATWFEPTAEGFTVKYDDTSAVYPVTIDPIASAAYAKASNTGNGDNFGKTVAISGDTIVIGAPEEDSNATGVNGDQSSNGVPGSGAAYVFIRTGTLWTQQAYLKASNAESNDDFGCSVAISGNTIVVGAKDESSSATVVNGNQLDNTAGSAGAAYVFVRNGSTWTQQAYLKANNAGAGDTFGKTSAISGNTIVVGADGEDSNATGVNGNGADNSAALSGAAYVFFRTGTTWTQQAYLKASNTGLGDGFGSNVSIDGDTVAIAARQESSNATGVNGDQSNNATTAAGAVYVFVRNAAAWTQQAYIKASNTGLLDVFGDGLSISGDLLVVGAGSEDSNATSINGEETNNLASGAGAGYLFRRTGTHWFQTAYLKADNAEAGDFFGLSMALSDDTLVVGAHFEDSNATGIGFPSADNSLGQAGAAYFFDVGERFNSLAKTGSSAPGSSDLVFGAAGQATIANNAGAVLFGSALSGAGASAGRNSALFSTTGNFGDRPDLALQRGSSLSGLLSLPANAKADSIFLPLKNDLNNLALFQVRVSGTGLNSSNNTLLFVENGSFVMPILRTGVAQAALGGAHFSSFREVVQRDFGTEQFALGYTLKPGIASVTSARDSGMTILSHTGAFTEISAREDQNAYGGGGKFGQFTGRMAVGTGSMVSLLAKFIPTGGSPLDSVFVGGGVTERSSALTQNQPAPGGNLGETVGTLPAIGRYFNRGMVKGIIKGSPTATNEAVWDIDGPGMLIRKGDDIGGGVKISRFVRLWGTYASQVFAQVVLTGTGINAKNNQALILRQGVGDYLILLQTGQIAPGLNDSKIKVGTLQSVDVDTTFGTYVVLASLTGVPASANQAVWMGITHPSIPEEERRRPRLVTVKGRRYFSAVTPGDTIRSMSLKPAVDASGISGRGLAQTINANGDFLLTLTGERAAKEFVKVLP